MVTGYLAHQWPIQFRGNDITGRAPREVSRTGICRSFQVAQLFPDLTVMENMMLAFATLQVGAASFFGRCI